MTKRKMTSEQKTGFKTPESYFENFTAQRLLDKGKKLPPESGFKIPADYFEKIAINPVEKKEKTVIPLFSKKIAIMLSAAAAIALLIFLNLDRSVQNKITDDHLSPAEIEHYIDNNNFDFEILEIDVSYDREFQDLNEELNKINRDSLLEYLIQNSEATTLLNN